MNDSPKPLAGLVAIDRAVRERCERLRSLAVDLLAADRATATRHRAAELRVEIASMMRAHHQEEETVLFPALMEAVAGSDPVCLRELTELLAAEHRTLERAWEDVRRALECVESGQLAEVDVEKFRAFIDGYLQHAEREEQELFPMAARLLTDAEIARIEQNLHARSTG